VADLDDVLDGLLEPLPDAVGAGAGLLGHLAVQQVVVEAGDDRDEFPLRLLGHARTSPLRGPPTPAFAARTGVPYAPSGRPASGFWRRRPPLADFRPGACPGRASGGE